MQKQGSAGIAASYILAIKQNRHFLQDSDLASDMRSANVTANTIAFRKEEDATGILANTATTPFHAEGKSFKSAEHYFHYQKLKLLEQKGLLKPGETADKVFGEFEDEEGSNLQAFMNGKSYAVPEEWYKHTHRLREKAMWETLTHKYKSCKEFRIMMNEISRCKVNVWEWRESDQEWGKTASKGGKNLAGRLLTGFARQITLTEPYDEKNEYQTQDYQKEYVPGEDEF